MLLHSAHGVQLGDVAAQAVHEELVLRSGVEGVPLSDRGDLVQMERKSATATYVDNLACFALDFATAKKGRYRVRECAVAHGLICHEDLEASEFEMLGHHFKGDSCLVTLTHKRFWRLDRALGGLKRRGRFSSDQLRVIGISHVGFHALTANVICAVCRLSLPDATRE